MDYVCEQMSVKEKDYFGLRFVDITRQRVSHPTQQSIHSCMLRAEAISTAILFSIVIVLALA